MNREQLCREFCKLNGIRCYAWEDEYPTFPDAKSILEVMMKRDDFSAFMMDKINCCWADDAIPILWILDSDKLLQKAVEWCREHPIL